MKSTSVAGIFCRALLVVLLVAFTFPGQSLGDNNGKGGKPPKKEKHYSDKGKKKGYNESTSGPDVTVNVYFNDQHRHIIRNYYRNEYRSGHCPPGLAKKNNGCMPPGQAKKWRVGYPLPNDVIVYDLPVTIIRQLGPPPSGHRYVRVATDILMIAVGTGLIVDAIQDLNSL